MFFSLRANSSMDRGTASIMKTSSALGVDLAGHLWKTRVVNPGIRLIGLMELLGPLDPYM